MSGLLSFFNCTNDTIYYSHGNNVTIPLAIYPMTPHTWPTKEGGHLTFVDKNNTTIGSIDQATRFLTVADTTKYRINYASVNNVTHLTLYSSSAKNPLSWMGDSLDVIGSKTLLQICIPGSHDAGMSVCQNATVAGHDCNTITQSQNILGQLNLGTRYFDLRPTISGGQYYTGHFNNLGFTSQGANGESFASIIQGINTFTSTNNCRELLIFKISQSMNTDVGNGNYRRFTQQEYNTLLDLLSTKVNNLYINTTQNLDLTQITLNTLISQKAKVLFIIDESNVSSVKPGETFSPFNLGSYSGQGFYTSAAFPLIDSYANAQDVETMATDQFFKMNQARATNKYFLLSWTLTQNDAQAGTCWLSSAAGTGIGAGGGTAAAGILELFTGLIPGIGLAVGAIAGAVGAQAASSQLGVSIRELAQQANLNLFDKIAPNLSATIFPNIIYTDFIENTNPLLLATSINDGSIFKKENTECLEMCTWSVSEKEVDKEQVYEYSTVSPTLAVRENPFFRQLFRIRRNSVNQLSFNYHVEGPDWTLVTETGQQSNHPPSSAWHNGILFIAYSYQNMVYMINSMNYGTYYHVTTAEGICLTNQPTSLVVWNDQLCLAYTDLQNNVHVVGSTSGTNGAIWQSMNAGSIYPSSNYGPTLTTVTHYNINYLVLMFTANEPTPNSVIVRQANTIYTSSIGPGSLNWAIAFSTDIATEGPSALASIGPTTYLATFSGNTLQINTRGENGGALNYLTDLNLSGIATGVSLFGDTIKNRLVIAYANQADGNTINLQAFDLSTNSWSKAEKLPAQCGHIPTFTQNKDSLSLVYVINNPSPYMCQIPGGYQAGWVKEQTLPYLSSFPAAMVWCYDQLYVAYLNDANTIYLTSTSNYSTWPLNANTGFTSANAPSLTVFNNTLYMAFTANDGSNTIQVASMAANGSWSSPITTGIKSLSTPALVEHNNSLYLAYRSGSGDNSLYVVSGGNGSTWNSEPVQLTYKVSDSAQASAVPQTSPNAPTLSSHNGHLYLLYTANDSSNTVYLASDQDNWTTLLNTGSVSRNSPSLVNYNQALTYAVVNRSAGSGTLYAGQTLATGQTLTSDNGLFKLVVGASQISLVCTLNSVTYWKQAANLANGLYFNPNGNLEGAGAPAGADKYIWKTPANTSVPAVRLSMEDNGTLKLYQPNGALLNTFGTQQYVIPSVNVS